MLKSMLVRAAAVSALVAVCGGSAGADTFLKMKGATGDAYQRGFEQQIVLTGASLSVMSTPDFGPDGEMLATRTRSSGPIYLSKTPDRSSPKLMQAWTALREKVAFWDQDREMAPDIAAAKTMIGTALFRELVAVSIAS